MTTAEHVRLLKRHGCTLIKHSARHDRYFSPITGKKIMVGRHSSEEVPTGTVRQILKDAGIHLKK